jgi:hypothetical protein
MNYQINERKKKMRATDEDKDLIETANQQSWFWVLVPVLAGALLLPKTFIFLVLLFGWIL